MKKQKIAVLMGGVSMEHEVSLSSGQSILGNIDQSKFLPKAVVISKKNTWYEVTISDIFKMPDPINNPREVAKYINKKGKAITIEEALDTVDVAFIALHGKAGEDGSIQGLLESMQIAYTGPNILASALGMDKLVFRKLLQQNSLPFPDYVAVPLNTRLSHKKVVDALGEAPFFVKPHNQGSSVGISRVENKKELVDALKLAWQHSDMALVDRLISGREFTVAVLGNESPKALPVVEIIPKRANFFDYESKYKEGGAEEICPAKVDAKHSSLMSQMALEVYKMIGASGFSRIDFLMDKKGKLYILEINTIPGLTPMSLFPKAANAAGISYQDLITKIITYAGK